MSKKKKSKKRAPTLKINIPRIHLERGYDVAKKILRHFDLDTKLLDVFTKKQRQSLTSNCLESPSVKAEREKTVPHRYVEQIRTEVYRYMKTTYVGNPDNQLTLMDFATYGMPFAKLLTAMTKDNEFVAPQEQVAKMICEKFNYNIDGILYKVFFGFYYYIHLMISSFSKVNFRLYTFRYSWEKTAYKANGLFPMGLKIWINARDCQTKMFQHNGKVRKAFRMIQLENQMFNSSWAVIPRKILFPKAKNNDLMNIYIQSHALHRFKERIDIFEPAHRNILIHQSLGNDMKVIDMDKQPLFICCIEKDYAIGYFTFFVSGNDIVINTFIPLVNERTPEGKKLHRLLAIGKDETVYLGMDKAGFYLKIDFDQIPVLKKALIESNIWQSKLALDRSMINKSFIDANKTQFVKNFFEKHKQHMISV